MGRAKEIGEPMMLCSSNSRCDPRRESIESHDLLFRPRAASSRGVQDFSLTHHACSTETEGASFGAIYGHYRTPIEGSQPANPCPIDRKTRNSLARREKKFFLDLILLYYSNHMISTYYDFHDFLSREGDSLRRPRQTISLILPAFVRNPRLMTGDQGARMIDLDQSRGPHPRKIPSTNGGCP